MKKTIAVFISIMMILGLAACGSRDGGGRTLESQAANGGGRADTVQNPSEQHGEESKEPSEGVIAEKTEEAGTEASAEDAEPGDGKILVVYYSATGYTESVANYIAEATGGELFRLEPVEEYSGADLNWTDKDSRVSREYANPDERVVELVESTVADWESYDTVFIGFPIWWGIAAWPVDGFVTGNDFTGKTVIPFCTSSTSGLGESGELLEEAAGTGEWLTGERFRSGASEETVQEWVESLSLE